MLNKKALAGTPSTPPVYVEDVFSTYLYTGNGSSQTITNGIDLSGKGGLVWIKNRGASANHQLVDTVRGRFYGLATNNTDSENGQGFNGGSFLSTGFSVSDTGANINVNTNTYCSWTFREQAKFFDVVTYTGDGSSSRTISHNLGSVPGMIIVKATSDTGAWTVYHRSLGATKAVYLNLDDAEIASSTFWNDTSPTSSVFTIAASNNSNTRQYVAYLFAHEAGGFGAAGTDNVISCGSYTGTGAAGNAITLGYEPQYLLLKRTDSIGTWVLIDNMRGFPVGSDDVRLQPNLSNAEVTQSSFAPTATGFVSKGTTFNGSGHTYIYMAIRRPMKTPTSGTEVFSPNAYAGADAGTTYTTNFPVDMTLVKGRDLTSQAEAWDRLRGTYSYLLTDSTAAEGTAFGTTPQWLVDRMTSVKWNAGDGYSNTSPYNYVAWNFKRATGFFDIVCYTGNGSNRDINHNLGVVPELMIVKRRESAGGWTIYSQSIANTDYLEFNTSASQTGLSRWNSTTPTSTVFTVGTANSVNESNGTYVSYLFATVAGVSKVGSYTGNGSNQTINCGFTAGARFVLIKRTDSTGDWYVYDTARGIVSGNDPQLKLNTTGAEATGYDAVDPANSGFIVNNDATNFPINVNNATYIYLAIA